MVTRDEIPLILTRDEANAAVDGLKHADATAGLPNRDARHGTIGKIQAAIIEADKPEEPPPEGGETGATGATRSGAQGASRRG